MALWEEVVQTYIKKLCSFLLVLLLVSCTGQGGMEENSPDNTADGVGVGEQGNYSHENGKEEINLNSRKPGEEQNPHARSGEGEEGIITDGETSEADESSSADAASVDYGEDFIQQLKREMGVEFDEDTSQTEDSRINALTTSQVRIVVDGVTLNLTPRPFIDNGTTFIPIRAISTHFGAGVSWDERTWTVGLTKGNTNISFVVGSTQARVNGKSVTVPPSRIVNGSTFVPVRFISETFGYKVGWNQASWTVTIDTTSGNAGTSPAPGQGPGTPTPSTGKTYTVVAGDSLWSIASRFGVTVGELQNWNNLTGDVIRVGQVLVVSQGGNNTSPTPAPPTQQLQVYTVVAGDTLSGIANRFQTTVSAIQSANNLSSDRIFVGQVLQIPVSGGGTSPPSAPQGVTKTFTTHTVRSGDNAWNLSIQYGIPMLELLKENNLSINSVLHIGQRLVIPVYHVPVRPVVSSRHGELLDWWTEARYVFPIGKEATITDFQSGTTFRIRHTMGGNHADAEPLTTTDANTMRQLWGGSFTWTPRAVIISVDGRRLAAAMHSFPHGDQVIRTNNYNGHFCIHFLNSTRHNDGLIQATMQTQVRIAAGVN